MMPTSVDGTFNSTIITRLSVPTSNVSDMPTETWISDSRNSRRSGRFSLATSAKGSTLLPQPIQRFMTRRFIGLIDLAVVVP